MKKSLPRPYQKIALLLLGLLFAFSSSAQNWHWQYPATHGVGFNTVGTIQVFDENNALAVNVGGTILKTADGGDTWQLHQMANSSTYGAFFYDADHGWVMDYNGGIHRTTDGGLIWTVQTTDLRQNPAEIFFTSPTEGWAVGTGENNALILKTTDGGATWQKVPLETTASRFNLVSFGSREVGFVMGYGNELTFFKTQDAGATWAKMPNPDPNLSFSNKIQFLDASTGFISDQFGGFVYKTTDGGMTWAKGGVAAIGTIQSFHFLDAQLGFVSDDQGNVFKTADGGTSWEQMDVNIPLGPLNSIRFVNPSIGYAVGSGSEIIKTEDGGQTWELKSKQRVGFRSVSPISQNQAWVVGENGTILATADGGQNWQPQTSGTTHRLNGVHLLDASAGWAGGNNGTILKYDGSAWAAQTAGTPSHLNGVQFLDTALGWAVADSGVVISTTDGGATWAVQPTGTDRHLKAVSMVNATNGWAVGTKGTVLKYDGSAWAALASPDTVDLHGVHFLDAQVGYAVGDLRKIFKTTDGGVTWAVQPTGQPFSFFAPYNILYGVHFLDADHGWVVGDGSILLRTADGGATWALQQSPGGATRRSVRFVDRDHGWMVGNHMIKKYTAAPVLSFANLTASFPYTAPLPGFTVQALQADGTVNAAFNGQVTVTKSTGGGAVAGTFTRPAVNGVATFDDFTFSRPGRYDLQAQATGYPTRYSAEFVATSTDATQLVFYRVEPAVPAQTAMPSFFVTALDANGYQHGGFRGTVTLAKVSGPGNVSGTLSKAAPATGRVTFNDVRFDAPGQYVLEASSGTLGKATSLEINVAGNVTATSQGRQPENLDAGNFPNPFSGATTFRFSLAHRAAVAIEVRDLLGRPVARLELGQVGPGPHQHRWEPAHRLAGGVYLYRLQIQDQRGRQEVVKRLVVTE